MGFPGYKDQSALSFLNGRSSGFLQFFTVRSTMSRQEISCNGFCFILKRYFSVLVLRESWVL